MSRQDDKLLGRVEAFAAGAGDDVTVEEMRENLEAAGVDVERMVSNVQDLLDSYERERKRSWLGARARASLEDARRSIEGVSAGDMSRQMMLDFLGAVERAGGTGAEQVGAFHRKHTGEPPSDDDLRSLVEALTAQKKLVDGGD